MKNTILISAVIAAGTIAVAYFVKKRRDAEAIRTTNAIVKRSHHRTNVFAKAKEHNNIP